MKTVKKVSILCGLILLMIGVSSCTNESDDHSKYEGLYCYDEPNDSSDVVEDHYILIESKEGNLVGYYYGTTDDFDEAREGYYPGYFVSEMKNLTISDQSICFSVQLFEDDIFTKPVETTYKKSIEISSETNAHWVNAQIFAAKDGLKREYTGDFDETDIVLTIDGDERVFKKLK